MRRTIFLTALVLLGLSACSTTNAPHIERSAAHTEELAEIQLGPVMITVTDPNLAVGFKTLEAESQIRYWVDNHYACGPERPPEYFEELFHHSFENEQWISYTIQTGNHPIATIALVPNAMGYTDMKTIREDFYACDAGVMQVVAFDAAWIVLALNPGRETDRHIGELADAIIGSIKFAAKNDT